MSGYYDILDLSKDASADDIKKSYRRLAMKYHPDRNPDNPKAEGKFKEAAEAYETLSDPQKRSQYDRFGKNAPSVGGFGGFGGGHDPFDIFNSFFGNRQYRKGPSLNVEIEIPLEDILTETKKTINFSRRSECKKCNGIGGSGETCPTCSGYGQIRQGHGFVEVVTVCPQCRGSKIRILTKCGKCGGQGNIAEPRTVTVKIPPGVQTGDRIKVGEEGELASGVAHRGDLICHIKIKPHSVFERGGADLRCVEQISFVDACLGTRINIVTLDKQTVNMKIPAGTQFGQTFKLKGKGVPHLRQSRVSPRGDQYVEISIEVPKKLNPAEVKILKQFDKKIKDRK